jgi:hypothetical protein
VPATADDAPDIANTAHVTTDYPALILRRAIDATAGQSDAGDEPAQAHAGDARLPTARNRRGPG